MELIKNIIFDFGGVIYNIDFNLAKEAFIKIGVQNFEQLYSKANQNQLFEKLEMDLISPAEFRDEIRKLSKSNITDEDIDHAWNSLLIGFDEKRIQLLVDLKKKYQIYLFSNTNRIHYAYFLKQFQQLTNYKSFDGLFVKSFLSFDIKRRKPNKDAYEYIIANMKLKPEQTLFIDDTIQNMQPAIEVGIKSWHLKEELLNLFEDGSIKPEIVNQLD
jgi:glucose-1-phosphatase